ncbi:anthranilate synthase component 1 [Marininema mesophilum]|uniref:Anthranilate synthase component 1 n=1 Tax=Marininema mesophilum TaxID=1048340 RepID=A0A1H2USX4_9BACL|nr:anthranilate synthase component I [Marininema mesophilum]SDW59150.1 anthranilate synthase component 1 [Marininema mesophilum]
MFVPQLEDVRVLARDYSTIPICKKIFADTETPIRLYQRLSDRKYSFLLESAEGGERRGRWSFIGTDPFLTVRARDGVATVTEGDNKRQVETEHPMDLLQELLSRYHSPRIEGLPPFLGGAVGYIGFEAVTTFEAVPRPIGHDSTEADDIHVMFCDRMLIVDHLKQDLTLVVNLHVPRDASDEMITKAYVDTQVAIDEWVEELRRVEPASSTLPPIAVEQTDVDFSRVQSNMTKEEYCAVVERAQEHIRRGDTFQLVPSQRWTWKDAPPSIDVYRVLRTLNPSPYMYHLSFDGEEIVGTSPEMLVRVTDGMIETRPIAGTRPRGADERIDQALAEELLADEKERAEHVMLVDLGRNDLGRVSRYGSVQVTEEMNIERYSHVMHMVSHVTGQLAEKVSPLDAFKACFPAGTVSGAPKVKAMELISQLEPGPRGIYAGAIGYFGFSGNLDSCITIRTLHFKNRAAYIQAGGGVVADSIPEKEYEESQNKARGMIRALQVAESLFQTMGGEGR